MAGDISKKTFDPAKDFSLVRMQQGRLFSDADWNEQGDILRASDRNTAADIIGHAGFPEDDAGFGLVSDAATGTLVITPGTGYVAGVSHVVRWPVAYTLTQVSGDGTNPVWRIDDGPMLADDDVLSTEPAGLNNFVRVQDVAEDDDGGVRTFRTTPALGNAVTTVFRPANVLRQPYGTGSPLPDQVGDYLALLKSADLAVTALDDPQLREVAFDGPDTAFRDRSIWQVSLVSRAALLALGYQAAELTCPVLANGLNPVIGNRKRGTMRARAELSDLSAGPCTLPPAAGYRSLDNLLYRVEIHNSGSETAALYKWSRENAIHRTRYRKIDAGVLVVESTGRDEMTALKAGDWVEIRDQAAIYGEKPGFFARIGEVVGQRIALDELRDPVSLVPLLDNGLPDTDKLPAEAFVTRWEGGLPVKMEDATTAWANLQSGVQVYFESGQYQTGDHWTIPARAVSGDIEWPRNPVTGTPLAKPPEGPRRDYAALAWLTLDEAGAWSITEDCRALFPPITQCKQVLYAGGDGQEALGDPLNSSAMVPLPRVLSVSVVRGHTPVAGEIIHFRVLDGNGQFSNGQPGQDIATDASGVASVAWSLDSTNHSQRIFAQRRDSAGTLTHTPIAFNATLSRAANVSFDPANTPELYPANTVQKAIEALTSLQQFGCTTYIIQPGEDWVTRLESLKADENASICFARGTYITARTVRMNRLGHIQISGAGPGTVRIVANRTEAALAFQGCAGVKVSGLEIATPDGNAGIDKALNTHRQGTLDFAHCNEVEVHGCVLSCGGGTSTQRTCLTVRGWSRSLMTLKVSQSVRITDNSLTVGNLQEGIVVTDAIDVDISGNRLKVRPGKGGLGIDDFLADKDWVSNAADSLISQPVKGNVGKGNVGKGNLVKGKGARQIAAREWRMTFHSPVSQSDWDSLVAANPPTDADLKDKDTFTRWAETLVAIVGDDPDKMPAFRDQLTWLKNSIDSSELQLESSAVRIALLISSRPMVQRFDANSGAPRQVVVEVNGHVVAFNSAFSQKDWNSLIARSGKASNIASADELLKLCYAMARRALKEKAIREGLSSVRNWFKTQRQNAVSLGAQGIVCGGRRLDNVAVRSNTIRDFEVGVRVAVSHLRDLDIRARSVLIDDNRMELLARSEDAYAGYGLMVGNVDTLRIRGNEMTLSKRPNFIQFFAQGIRIWGYIGHQVLVAENRISMATMGIRLESVNDVDEKDSYLWVFRENLIQGPSGIQKWMVSPSWVLIDQNNLMRTLP